MSPVVRPFSDIPGKAGAALRGVHGVRTGESASL